MTDKKLISLKDSNDAVWEAFLKKNPPAPNGIACPECGKELWDDCSIQILWAPRRIAITCIACEFRGWRYA